MHEKHHDHHHHDHCCHDHHHHVHDESCTCEVCRDGHHHGEGSVPEEATLLSLKKTFSCEGAASSVVENAKALFRAVGEQIAFEDIIPGHLKGAIQSGGAILGLSMTRLDTVDLSPNAAWERLGALREYTVTVNVLTVLPTELTQPALERMMMQAFQI